MGGSPRQAQAFASAILVGGAGTRLRPRKPLLRVGGVPIVERAIEALRPLGSEIALIGNDPEVYGHLRVACIPDARPGCGPLGGILTALTTASTERVLVVAGDLPFLQPSLLAALVSWEPHADCVVPEWSGRLEPLHAVYRRGCADPIRAMLDRGQTCPLDLFPRVRTAVFPAGRVARHDPAGRSFVNVNTPDDLRRAERLVLETVLGPSPALSDPHVGRPKEAALHGTA